MAKDLVWQHSEEIETKTAQGRIVKGMLFTTGRNCVGQFRVAYGGASKTDGRTYSDPSHLRSIARRVLSELANEV